MRRGPGPVIGAHSRASARMKANVGTCVLVPTFSGDDTRPNRPHGSRLANKMPAVLSAMPIFYG